MTVRLGGPAATVVDLRGLILGDLRNAALLVAAVVVVLLKDRTAVGCRNSDRQLILGEQPSLG